MVKSTTTRTTKSKAVNSQSITAAKSPKSSKVASLPAPESPAPEPPQPAISTHHRSSLTSELRFTCTQENLAAALSFVKAALPTKPLHPILANVLIQAEFDRISLTVSDMALTLQASFEGLIACRGAIALPLELLVAVVNKCPAGDIHVTSSVQSSSIADQLPRYAITLTDSQTGTIEIQGNDPNEFPDIRATTTTMTLPSKVAKVALKGVLFATAADDQQTILTGVHWSFDTDQRLLRCTTCDGHQVALVSIATEGIGRSPRKRKSAESLTCVIPQKTARELLRLLDKVDVKAELSFGYQGATNQAIFELDDEEIHKQLICQCPADPYPDVQQALDRFQYPKQFVVAKADLLKKLDRLSALADAKANAVQLAFDVPQQQLHLSIERHYGKGQQLVSAQIPQPLQSLSLGFNIRYLLDAVKAIASSTITFHLDQPTTPINLIPSGDSELPEANLTARYFIMPVVINGSETEKAPASKTTTSSRSAPKSRSSKA